MIVDHHLHLERDSLTGPCRYNRDRIAEYVAVARQQGVDAIGISEHCHRFGEFRSPMAHLIEPEPVTGGAWLARQFNHSLDAYVAAVLEAKEAGMPVLLGLEVDFLPGHEGKLRELLSDHPWDYVIGSVHFLPGWAVDASATAGWPTADVDATYRTYFAYLRKAAASGLYDIMAHPDLVKKFGHRPSFDPAALYRETANAFAASGVSAELSTAGWHKPVVEAYPAPTFLNALCEAGVTITLGSDAHSPGAVGRDFDKALSLARHSGYRQVAAWSGRQRSLYSLTIPPA